jgi:hypothetical protein
VTRFIGLCLTIFAMAGVSASAATGDGLPIGNVDAGPAGVTSAAGAMRYVTVPAGRNTLALAIRRDGGQVGGSRVLRGRFTIPVVALDGTPGGLSADRRTLVLIKPRLGFPRKVTTFAVLDAQRMKLRDVVRLRGDFSFDALSADGRLVYLVKYTSRHDPTRYEVRAFDTRQGRLVPGAIVDKREPDENMRGYPLTRAMSPDGRWAYTLYDGAGKHPFVHALDTREMTAACIDLDGLTGRKDLQALRLGVSGDGSRFSVLDGRQALFVVDTETFRVREVTARVGGGAGNDDGGISALWAVGIVALVGLGGIVLLVRRRNPVATT